MTTDRPPGPGTRAQGRRSRRGHAAARGRLVAAGVSAGATLALVAAMAGSPPSAAPADAPAGPVVVAERGLGAPSAPATNGRAPAVSRTDAPPVTSSRAS